MNTVLLPSDPFDATQAWLTARDRAQLVETIGQAISRAHDAHRAIVASYSRAIPSRDLISFFTATPHADAFYWEQPSRDLACVGLGATHRITANGPDCMIGATEMWRTLLRDAVCVDDDTNPENADAEKTPLSGPICFGGFAFDPLGQHTPLWADFPDGLLSLPQALMSRQHDAARLTLNALVNADDLPEDVAERLIANVMRLRVAVERLEQDGYPRPFAEAGDAVILTEHCSRAEWMRLVSEATVAIRRGNYHKIVLARGVQVERKSQTPGSFFTGEANVCATLQRLRQGDPKATVFAIRRSERIFIGATPERLARVTSGRLQTMALAGTTARGKTSDDDARLARELSQSAKNREEHAIVASSIAEALRPLCQRLDVADTPQVIKMATVQHLRTPITGVLATGVSALDVVAALHPTPAVGGFPRQAALEAIRAHEGLDRGWYAGPVGWLGPEGDGEFVVALRSALLAASHATLFGGCGVMADSDPAAEYAESQIKLRVMLRGLGVGEG